eukprot:366006-Chlamydomonas_euryale.AAC.6
MCASLDRQMAVKPDRCAHGEDHEHMQRVNGGGAGFAGFAHAADAAAHAAAAADPAHPAADATALLTSRMVELIGSSAAAGVVVSLLSPGMDPGGASPVAATSMATSIAAQLQRIAEPNTIDSCMCSATLTRADTGRRTALAAEKTAPAPVASRHHPACVIACASTEVAATERSHGGHGDGGVVAAATAAAPGCPAASVIVGSARRGPPCAWAGGPTGKGTARSLARSPRCYCNPTAAAAAVASAAAAARLNSRRWIRAAGCGEAAAG